MPYTSVEIDSFGRLACNGIENKGRISKNDYRGKYLKVRSRNRGHDSVDDRPLHRRNAVQLEIRFAPRNLVNICSSMFSYGVRRVGTIFIKNKKEEKKNMPALTQLR